MCARTLYQLGNIPATDMMDVNKYPSLPRFSHALCIIIMDEDMYDIRHQNKGRPRLTTKWDLRVIKRQINVLRESSRNFSAINLQKSCGISSRMSVLTFRTALNSCGYNYRNTHRKGMVLKKDVKARRTWCGKAIQHYLLSHNFWRAGLSIYVDGVGFEYNPTHMNMQNV